MGAPKVDTANLPVKLAPFLMRALLTAFSGPRPVDRPVRLTPSEARPGVAFVLDEGEEEPEWLTLGPVAHRISNLTPQGQALASKARKSQQGISESWPKNARLRLSYIGKVKEAGQTFMVYRFRNVLRFVPESAQPPRRLYMDPRELQEPVLVADTPTPAFAKLGRLPVPVALRSRGLVDDPDEFSSKAKLLVMPVALSQASVDRASLEAEIANVVQEFESTRASPEFRRWFEGASSQVRNEDGSPKVFFRGQTAGAGELKARLTLDSFTDSSDVASIYSTSGGVVQDGSNVIPVYIDVKNPLKIPHVSISFYDMLTYLGYWDETGITHEETVKMLNYLAKRKRASESGSMFGLPKSLKSFEGMPSFKYQVKNEEDTDNYADFKLDDEEDEQINFDELGGMEYQIDTFRKLWADELEWQGAQSTYAKRLSLLMNVDTFAMVETPAAKRALEKLGYDGVIHLDPFSAEDAAQEALGKGMDDLVGVEEGEEDLDWEDMSAEHVHWTVRPLDRSQVWPVLSSKPMAPAKKLAARARRP